MSARAFVDTNILVYAHDSGSGWKHERSRSLIGDLWRSRTGVLSTQVFQEFYVNVRRKAEHPLSAPLVREILNDYSAWTVVVNDQSSILDAIALEERYQISFWDALIVQAAQSANAEILYSEDLSHGQRYGSVELVNPLMRETREELPT